MPGLFKGDARLGLFIFLKLEKEETSERVGVAKLLYEIPNYLAAKGHSRGLEA